MDIGKDEENAQETVQESKESANKEDKEKDDGSQTEGKVECVE